MPISCVAFCCTNKQKSKEKRGEGSSSSEKNSENNEISLSKQNVAFHRYVLAFHANKTPASIIGLKMCLHPSSGLHREYSGANIFREII